MKITLNNREEHFDVDAMSVSDLIIEKNFTFKLLVTKINDKLVKKEERDKTMIKDGDKVTVLHMVSGG